jgi:hypothetical protein
MEAAESRYRHVQLNRVKLATKCAAAFTGLDDRAERAFQLCRGLGYALGTAHESALDQVLGLQQPLEVRVLLEVADREDEQLLERAGRIGEVELKFGFLATDIRVGSLDDRKVEALLALEVMVNAG